jgi:integrase
MPDGTRIRQNFKEKAANLMRPSEIRDLKPEDVFKDKIRVSGGKLRRMLKRSVPISPVQEQMEMDRMRAGRRTTRNSGVGRPGRRAPYRENEVACD